MADDATPPLTPAVTTTVKTTVGPEAANGTQSVIVVTQSKIALLSQAQASVCAVLFTVAICIVFVAPVFTGGEPIITEGAMIGLVSGFIGGVAAATRGATRATDNVAPSPHRPKETS